MAAFPGALATFAGFVASHTLSVDNHAAQHNLEQAEILAAQTKLGTGSSTPTAGTVLTSTGVGTSSWSQVNLTTMVSGILPTANGGTGTTSTTGSGSVVFSTSPTIASPSLTGGGSWAGSPTLTTPTIASFINMLHTHANAAGGGQLGFSALLATIFSGQVQTVANPGSAGGTLYYINLGGIKLIWGSTAAVASGSSYTITWPAGFLTTIQAAFLTPAFAAGTDQGYANGSSAANTTDWTFNFKAVAGSGSMPIFVFAVGT